MKQLRLTTIVVFAIMLVGFFSCKKESVNSKASPNIKTLASMTDAEIIADVADLGSKHNAALDLAYNNLFADKTNIASITNDEDRVDEIVENIIASGYEYTDGEYGAGVLGTSEQAFYDDAHNYVYYDNFDGMVNDFSVSTTLENLLLDIKTMIQDGYNNSQSAASFASDMDDFLDDHIDDLASNTEKYALASGVSVGKSSYAYWSNSTNNSKWADLYDDLDFPPDEVGNPARIDVTFEDVVSAVGSGIYHAVQFSGLGPGGATLGFFAGVVHGAMTGSASAYLWQKAKEIFWF